MFEDMETLYKKIRFLELYCDSYDQTVMTGEQLYDFLISLFGPFIY